MRERAKSTEDRNESIASTVSAELGLVSRAGTPLVGTFEASRAFLAPSIRDRIPPFTVGLSHPHLARYQILGEQQIGAQTYRFQIRFDTDAATGTPLVPGPVGTYTVRDVPDESGLNHFWLITEMPTER